MKEIDRIIMERGLPESFLLPEVKCGYQINENQKKIWAISLDLLQKFDEVCNRNNLRYYLAYGSLLGAIRHNGFIPWDDDVDVCMPRKDYEVLLTLTDEFNFPYFLQTPYTDARYYYSYVKLRNSNTTSLSKNYFADNNNGISLDIFCVDNWEKSKEGEALYERIKELIISNSTFMKLGNPNFRNDERVMNYNGADPMKVYHEIQKLAKTYYHIDTEYVSMPIITVYGYNKDIFLKEDFADITFHNFEFLNLPIPKGYDNILKCVYGDYMSFPPEDQRGKWHTAIIDADHPYTYYLDMIKKGVNIWK